MWSNFRIKAISCGDCFKFALVLNCILDLHVTITLKNKTDERKTELKHFVNTSNVIVIGWLLHEDSNRKSAVDIHLVV